jgi:hypothetical protein
MIFYKFVAVVGRSPGFLLTTEDRRLTTTICR